MSSSRGAQARELKQGSSSEGVQARELKQGNPSRGEQAGKKAGRQASTIGGHSVGAMPWRGLFGREVPDH